MSAVVLIVAAPALREEAPSVTLPSLKVTVPVAAVGAIVAVNVTLAPKAGLEFDVVSVVVVELALGGETTIVTALLTLGLLSRSPA